MNKISDNYKERLDQAKKDLIECQKNMKLKSCFNCDKVLDCETRKKYTNAVYSSMSNGQSGGFEF